MKPKPQAKTSLIWFAERQIGKVVDSLKEIQRLSREIEWGIHNNIMILVSLTKKDRFEVSTLLTFSPIGTYSNKQVSF